MISVKGKSKLISECTAFWNAVYKLMNEDRILPAGEDGITTKIDESLSLTITSDWAMLVRNDTNAMCAKMRRSPNKDDLTSFVTLLAWYLKRRMSC